MQPDNAANIPPIVPPQTNAPTQLNQQVNIQQIPPRVWEKLTPEQIVALSNRILDQVESMDKRHFEIAKHNAHEGSKNRRIALY